MKKPNPNLIIPMQTVYQPQTTFLHIDYLLLMAIIALLGFGLVILYSAANQHVNLVYAQASRIMLGLVMMTLIAQVPPYRLEALAKPIYLTVIVLLAVVLVIGHIGKGAQRWLDVGVLRFQPSEMMKLALPLVLASFLSRKRLPPNMREIIIVVLLTLIPALLIAKQPDLGTAIIIVFAGFSMLFFAGIRWQFIIRLLLLFLISLPVLWYVMRDYQRQRVLTFLYPERDPLGSGYHIIQSKIAIGSGGILGKGWLLGTQAHLAFLPEHSTDFIFAVCGEEFGFLGATLLISLYLLISARCLFISVKAQDSFSRLVAGSLAVVFFCSAFVNIGMVSGILPVVGLPLPLVSYGGTSVVIMLAGFGVIMSVAGHRKLVTS